MKQVRINTSANGCCCFTCIPQATVGILERMGQFEDVLPPGCHCYSPLKELKGTVNLRIEILEVVLDCPTKEKTSVRTVTHVMHRVIPSYVHTAFYSLSGARQQVTAFVQNALRAAVPNYTVDELFVTRFDLAEAVKRDLEPQMTRFGREIVDLLIADIDPTVQVKQMYNMQMTNRYARIANQYKVEAEKIEIVKKAEAEAECARLAGVGAAEQRKVISSSLALNLQAWREAEARGERSHESEVIATMMMLQYFDMMNDVMKSKNQGGIAPAVVYLPTLNAAQSGLRQRKSTDDSAVSL